MLAIINSVSFVVGVIGGLVIVFGVVHVLVRLLQYWLGKKGLHREERSRLDEMRLDLGRYIVLGLEFFIAKDIIKTLIVPTWAEIGMLAVLIIVRTILSYFLTKELDQIEARRIEHRKIDAGIK